MDKEAEKKAIQDAAAKADKNQVELNKKLEEEAKKTVFGMIQIQTQGSQTVQLPLSVKREDIKKEITKLAGVLQQMMDACQ